MYNQMSTHQIDFLREVGGQRFPQVIEEVNFLREFFKGVSFFDVLG